MTQFEILLVRCAEEHGIVILEYHLTFGSVRYSLQHGDNQASFIVDPKDDEPTKLRLIIEAMSEIGFIVEIDENACPKCAETLIEAMLFTSIEMRCPTCGFARPKAP